MMQFYKVYFTVRVHGRRQRCSDVLYAHDAAALADCFADYDCEDVHIVAVEA